MALLVRASSSRELDGSLVILLAPWTGSMMPKRPRFVTELSICMRKKIAPSLGAICCRTNLQKSQQQICATF